MRPVTYCKNSTITEAWAEVLGLPGEPDQEEVAALAHMAKKRFGNLRKIPSVVLMQQPKSASIMGSATCSLLALKK
ncbi:MAG: hypothetical protein ETSY2_00005 [Candidatus Entotheonella gemina]|uniref:Uncharacterized protein n=1 Tax=Candidatus Entotheonella gemina TaxID=1429439 RepID=W4MHD5_9BACT|nr:MAG: hypothetical protein ETSY2_00005 [Candidatus Entotheonella gemina]